MKKLNIKIKLKSPTLLSNGEPEGLYDDSYVQDEYRLPIFPAKRLKGLLRESCLELLEWSGNKLNTKEDIIDFIFGKSGASNETTTSRIQIQNGEIIRRNEWTDIVLNSQQKSEILSAIDSYFSIKVAQTQIEENGLAKEGSLRQFKLLAPKEEACFETTIILSEELGDDLIELIKAGLLNIRRVGTGRNRGWGKVQIKLEGYDTLDKINWGNITTPSIQKDRTSSNLEQNHENIEVKKSSFETIPLKITAKSNLILPKWSGDENMISSKDYIPGSMLWGAFAGIFIKTYGKGVSNIMDDPRFKFLFYQGGLHFKPAFLFDNKKIYTYSPRHWVRSKLKPDDPYKNMFDETIISGKPEGKLSHFDLAQEKYEVLNLQKTQTFHNSRGVDKKSRLAGSNQDSGIYYYESVNKNAVFYTELRVESDYQDVLLKLINQEEIRLGKSKNNQFGRAFIKVTSKLKSAQTIEGKQFDVTFESPTILTDSKGYTNLSQSILAQNLEINESKITNANIRKEMVQRFQGNLNTLLPANEAITPGSSFRLENITEKEMLKLNDKQVTGIGLETEKGFGRFRIESTIKNQKFKKVESTKEKSNDSSFASYSTC